MNKDMFFGWLFALYGAVVLIVALFANDMGGLTSLGYNPDLPMSFGRAPGRFLLGILLNGAIGIYGIRLITGASTLRKR